MSENCNHDCSSCAENCESRKQSFLKPLHEGAAVGRVIAVVSGKGGVGKSLVTSLLACEMQRRGHRTAVLDADITGPPPSPRCSAYTREPAAARTSPARREPRAGCR